MSFKIYLAGPFFNPEQVALIRELEKIISPYQSFSPSRDGKVCPPNASNDIRRDVFMININEIMQCNLIVAVMEWVGDELYQLPYSKVQDTKNCSDFEDNCKQVSIPDSGTVFEIAYGYAQGVPTIGVYTKDENAKRANLMLAESMLGITTVSKLEAVLKDYANMLAVTRELAKNIGDVKDQFRKSMKFRGEII